jgi:L-ascorbate metabolism protein UlaG (beta-lactamase superfamily)
MSVAVTRVINACVLLDIEGDLILSDPCFEPPRGIRFTEPFGLRVEDLPRLAAILVGHRVRDHWQCQALRHYRHRESTPVFVPGPRMARVAQRVGLRRAEVLRWGETRTVGRLRIDCAPGERVGAMRTNTYVITSSSARVLLATEARRVVPEAPVDVALLPIDGAQLFGRPLVMDAPTAAATAQRLGAVLVPIHYSQRARPPILRCPSGPRGLPKDAHVLPVGVRTVVWSGDATDAATT